ncbi:hypothetical protein GQ53DRAFT_379858 [Thozetella sp. PMI_491]|nr:hypothetical protein GQ53DRAFT_379858 [Thozetella sp. PMI_491]
MGGRLTQPADLEHRGRASIRTRAISDGGSILEHLRSPSNMASPWIARLRSTGHRSRLFIIIDLASRRPPRRRPCPCLCTCAPLHRALPSVLPASSLTCRSAVSNRLSQQGCSRSLRRLCKDAGWRFCPRAGVIRLRTA